MYQLIYTSKSSHAICPLELESLLERSRRKNAECGVTGILVYHDRTFLQLLEGEARVVQSLYRRIRLDPRHMDSRILAEEIIAERRFDGWNMGLLNADTCPLWNLPNYSQSYDERYCVAELAAHPQRAEKFLVELRDNKQWREHVDAGQAHMAEMGV